MKVRFRLVDLNTGALIVESYSDPATGDFLVVLPTGKDYALDASAKGYMFFSDNLRYSEVDQLEARTFDVPMRPIDIGEKVVLKNVFFETSGYDLKSESRIELLKVIEFMEENPEVKLEVGGHTDNTGSLQTNQVLSENRAKSVYDFLLENGAEESRLSYKGYNFQRPIADNNTEEGKALNRRTEIMVVN